MVTAHPPSSVSTLWSCAGCTHAPLIGSSALSGVSWMCALLTRIGKPPQKLLRWGGSGKTTLGFWLFPCSSPACGPKGKPVSCRLVSLSPLSKKKAWLACDINKLFCITPPYFFSLSPPQRQRYQRSEQYASGKRNSGQTDEWIRHSVEARFRR